MRAEQILKQEPMLLAMYGIDKSSMVEQMEKSKEAKEKLEEFKGDKASVNKALGGKNREAWKVWLDTYEQLLLSISKKATG